MESTNVYNDNLATDTVRDSIGSIEQSFTNSFVNNNQDLHYLYRQAPLGIMVSLLSALLVCWLVIPAIPDYIYIPWLAFLSFTALTHSWLIKEFGKQKNTLHINNQWALYHTFMTGTTALAFSVGYLLFLPLLEPFTQISLLLILASMSVIYLPILCVFLPSYIIYISGFIFPIILWIYGLPAEEAYPITAMLAISYCTLIIIASHYSRTLYEAFDLVQQINNRVKTLNETSEETRTTNLKLQRHLNEEIKYNDSIRQEKDLARFTLQSIGEGIISTDAYGRINYMNPVAEIYTGWVSQDANGKDIDTVLKLVDESSHVELDSPVRQCIEMNTTVNSNGNSLLVRRDGLEYAIEFSTNPIIRDESNFTGTVMIFRDVTEKRTMEKDLNWQAKHDPLTGLINRREFENRLNKIIKTNKSDREHALCYIDLDHFKRVNDSCGHHAGDELLQRIADRLRKITRDTDTLARLGGDEFAVIMYSCTLDKAKLIAEIFREEVYKTKFEWDGKSFTVSASIGIVSLNDATENLTELQRVADTACYRAKDAGGNRVDIYEPDKTDQIQHVGELKVLEDIQQHLEKENFKLFTQKIQPLDEMNDIKFHEVLLRMQNTEGDFIAANHFIHVAKNYHMLSDIDNWVLKVVMELIAYGNPLFNESHMISINLSEQTILNEQFINYAIDILNDYDIPAGNICFELSQPQFYGNDEKFRRFVTLIKRQGCKIALDDFICSPINISTMRELKIDYIKLDARQFQNLSNEQDFNYKLLESINNIIHLMGSQTIIKCIDNIECFETLYEIGTDYIQGYAIEAPQVLNNMTIN